MPYTFRELVRPGTNFEFVGRIKLWVTISGIALLLSLAMLPINKATRGSILNWSVDFKGGTEVVMTFPEKEVAAGDVRAAVRESGHPNVDVSTFELSEAGKTVKAYLIRLPQFGAVPEDKKRDIRDALIAKFGTDGRQVITASWSGDNFSFRANKPIPPAELEAFFKEHGETVKPPTPEQARHCTTPAVGVEEYVCEVSLLGLDRQLSTALSEKLGTKAEVKQVEAVGAKAGEELRNGAIKSLFYAILLIMLYIALRFDVRYSPGTVAALIHDSILVVGIFAITWTEFSLTTVAALLTVIGYSMNDTVVVFDRIRENEHRLKDKKFDRVINISVNETLSRTLLTSLTTFSVTLSMNILGTGLVKNFAFALNIGIIVGAYSTIFIAAPILLVLNDRFFSKRTATSPRERPSEPEPA